jgi:carboxylesterase
MRHHFDWWVVYRFGGCANAWYTFLLPLARFVPFVQSANVKEEEPFGLKDQRMREFIQRQMLSAGKSEVGAASLSIRGLVQSKLLIRATRRALAAVTAPLLLKSLAFSSRSLKVVVNCLFDSLLRL